MPFALRALHSMLYSPRLPEEVEHRHCRVQAYLAYLREEVEHSDDHVAQPQVGLGEVVESGNEGLHRRADQRRAQTGQRRCTAGRERP